MNNKEIASAIVSLTTIAMILGDLTLEEGIDHTVESVLRTADTALSRTGEWADATEEALEEAEAYRDVALAVRANTWAGWAGMCARDYVRGALLV